MKCEDCLTRLEEYFDGELQKELAGRVAAHLASCSRCAAAHSELIDEQEIYSRYKHEVEVTPALWAGVRKALAEERWEQGYKKQERLREKLISLFSTARFSLPLTAALIFIAIIVTIGVMRYMSAPSMVAVREPAAVEPSREEAAVQQSGAASEAASAPNEARQDEEEGNRNQSAKSVLKKQRRNERAGGNETANLASRNAARASQRVAHRARTPDELVREAEQKYVAAIQLLSRDVNRRRRQLDPETLARFDQTLAAIDRTIVGTRRAVREHPEDPVAVQYMLTAYAKKVEVLREIGGY
ncbi:MAG: hypothetical protein AUG51_14110 [Acidobacteria bacterium 13_1_20CM_3_53_8]|nr:MAG: hypothetical protein AUG51_14110 [Acidobacteria bacterium 13_1_20CM_3_53_8]